MSPLLKAIAQQRAVVAVVIMLGMVNSTHAQGPPAAAQIDFFETKIRPVLIANCYECHSADSKKIKSGLLLDTRDGLLKGGNRGPAIIPGDPRKSLLIINIRHEGKDPKTAMPQQKEKLSDAVIADFEQWVNTGAADPRTGQSTAKPATASDVKNTRHWAFAKIVQPPIPNVADATQFVQHPIDRFILAKLKEKKLQPSPKADRHTLIRRITYDLTGLPPTPEEVDAYLADTASNALEKVIDRLLDSPRYGERWGRHWLDIARYADTTGDRSGGARRPVYPHAWTYRDYVIDAFNKDLPYDRFIIEQIAADRLPETQHNKSRLAALGFLTVGKRFMGNVNDVLDDRIDVVTRGLMGLTAACARCHDHKFDPIPTEDYYSLHGIFNSSDEPRDTAPLFDPARNPAYPDYLAEVEKIEQEVTRYGRAEAARVISGMLEDTGVYMLVAHNWLHRPDAKKGDSTSYYGLRANLKKGQRLELAYPWLVRMPALENGNENDPVFGPWAKFAKLPAEKLHELAPALVKEIASSTEVNPSLAKAFVAKSPMSLTEVAAVYTDVFLSLHQQLQLDRFHANSKTTYDISKTQVVLDDPAMEALRKYLYGSASPIQPDEATMTRSQYLYPRTKSAIRSQIVSLDLTHPGAPVRAMALVDKPAPKDSRIFVRGEPENLGPVAPRRFLQILAEENRKPFSDGSGRLELAHAIVSRDNPLTSRVMVNRVWQWHFGQAIVRTVSDFGTRSEPPTHPELLDWLATWFMDNGWSLKKLHKLIVSSATYQQQSLTTEAGIDLDATNQWLWRFNIRRLDFEEIRDTLLFMSQSLDPTMGGPPFSLGELGPNMARPKYAGADFSGMKGNSPMRRTVYALIDRSGLTEVFNTFDFADPDMSTGERVLTTVPQQALFMMNSPFIAERVKNLLTRPDFPTTGNDEDKVRFIFRLVFQRPPHPEELELARQFLKIAATKNVDADSSTPLPANPASVKNSSKQTVPLAVGKTLSPWERYTQVILLTNELLFIN